MGDKSLINRRASLGVGLGAASAVALGGRAFGAGPAQKVKVVMTQGLTGLAVQEIAQSQGYFAQFNVEPEVLLVSDGGKCVAALVSGASQLCAWSGFNQVTPAIERGAAVKILAGSLNLPSLSMYSAEPEVRKIADLQGKTIGIGAPGAVLHQMVTLLLQKKGVDPAKVLFRNVGSNADILKAVSAKSVDAGPSDVAVFDQQQKFGVHNLTDGMLWTEIPEYTNQASYASQQAIRQDRDLLVRTLAAYGKAYRFISGPGSREAYVRAWRKVSGAADIQQAVTQWNWIQKFQPYATGLTLSDARMNLVQNLNLQFKVQRQVLPISAIADMSLARDALKLLG